MPSVQTLRIHHHQTTIEHPPLWPWALHVLPDELLLGLWGGASPQYQTKGDALLGYGTPGPAERYGVPEDNVVGVNLRPS